MLAGYMLDGGLGWAEKGFYSMLQKTLDYLDWLCEQATSPHLYGSKPLSRQEKRRLLRAKNRRQYLAASRKPKAESTRRRAGRITARTFILAALVFIVLAITHVAAVTPEMVIAVQLLTGNLAAWELSTFHPGWFSTAANWHELKQRQQGIESSAGPALLAKHLSSTKHSPIDPLQIDELLPGGDQSRVHEQNCVKDEENLWLYGKSDQATPEQMARLRAMLLAKKQVFAYSLKDMPGYTGPPAVLEMVPNARAFIKPRNYSPLEKDIMDEKCQELKEAGIIIERDTRCDFASAPVMPAKKDPDGNWTDRRFAIDYRFVNDLTVPDGYKPPLPETIFNEIKGCTIHSHLDLRAAFMQLPLHPKSQHITAFWWHHKLYQFTRMPNGLKNATSIWQRVIDQELERAGLSHCARAFVDDILISSRSIEEHIEHVAAVLDCLLACNLRVHPAKSVFATDKVEYLGHLVTPNGLEPLAAKVAAMAQLPEPRNVSELRSCLGLLSYYRCYILNFSTIAKPLNDLLKKGVKYVWGSEQQRAFDALKRELCTPGKVLRQPDPTRQYILHTDWSTHGIGAVLCQLDDNGKEYIVACISRSLNKHEQNYEPWKGELLAVVWAVKSFRVYLHGVHFEICTDHRPLLWLLSAAVQTGQQARWVLQLQDYDFHIRHRAGVTHNNADVPSRFPLATTADFTGARLDKDTDPTQYPLPKVVFGPIGTGTPVEIPPEQIPSDSKELHALFATPTKYTAQLFSFLAVTSTRAKARFFEQQATQLPAAELAAVADLEFRSMHPADSAWGTHIAAEPDTGPSAQRTLQQQWQQSATAWVAQAANQCLESTGHGSAGVYTGPRDKHGVRHTVQLNTASVLTTYFTAAQAGVVLYEPFGGICAGLEMVLKAGTPVKAYLYSDISPVCRKVAVHRIQQLRAQFPHLLPASAVEHTFSMLPQDVKEVTTSHLLTASHVFPNQWLVVGGWECQNLSPAGDGKGLSGSKSSTFYDLVRIIGAMQQLQKQLPPAYLIENTALQHNWNSEQVRKDDFRTVCSYLGHPVCLDAAQFNSLAHRVRDWWTNLCPHEHLTVALSYAKRSPGLKVQDILPPGRVASRVQHVDMAHLGFYPCNLEVGAELSAWPTVVAYQRSHAFMPYKQGAVRDYSMGTSSSKEPFQWSEPTADECEIAMGYSVGTTAAPGVSSQQRRQLMGRCMDANNLQAIYAVAAAWYRHQHWTKATPQFQISINTTVAASKSETDLSSKGIAASLTLGPVGYETLTSTLSNVVMAAVAEQLDYKSPKPIADVWEDEHVLYYLREQHYMKDTSNEERNRVKKRAASYVLAVDGKLLRNMADGSTRIIPRPSERLELIKRYHEQCGHFGVRRTAALIQTSYWWWGLLADVAAHVAKCSLCSRVRTSFNTQQPTLQPLPINGMMYRWHVDLAGPLPRTQAGNVYIMVAIEAFSKHLELVPLPNKHAFTTAFAFAHNVLGRFGSCAEVVTDRGSEWAEQFDQLLQLALIDHRRTSAGRPQSDGLAERAVQTVKRALKKLCAAKGTKEDWDLELPWLALGYRCSPQQSTGLSPYQMLYARNPTIPPAIVERMAEPFNLDDPDVALKDFKARAALVKKHMVIAGDNLRIAQHRDTLRYAAVRDGSYLPKIRRFEPGDFVWLSRNPQGTLDIRTKPLILRVVEVKKSGVLKLQDRACQTIEVHSSKCAPCHLPDIDPRVDPTIAIPGEDLPCEVCHSPDDEAYMVLCDSCNKGWHTYCVHPALEKVPESLWICPDCISEGVTIQSVEHRRKEEETLEVRQQHPEDYTPAQQKARALHGRLVVKSFKDPVSKLPRQYWGKLFFRGHGQGDPLLAVYEDGDEETCSMRTMKRRGIKLMPEGTSLPTGIRIPDRPTPQLTGGLPIQLVSGPVPSQVLPPYWDLSTTSGLTSALNTLLPGEYTDTAASAMIESIKQYKIHFRGPQGLRSQPAGSSTPVTTGELHALACAVDFSGCHRVLDPFAGRNRSISEFFKLKGCQVLVNDLDPSCARASSHLDALQPSFYGQYPAQVIVTRPPATLLDLAAPLVSLAASVVSCVLVPAEWVYGQQPARQHWRQGMSNQGRIHLLKGPGVGPVSSRRVWLVVFSTPDIKKQLLSCAAGQQLS